MTSSIPRIRARLRMTTRFLFCFCALVSFTRPLEASDFGYLWWADGNPYYYNRTAADAIPADYPGKRQVLSFQTGKYAMSLDTITLGQVKLVEFEQPISYEADIQATTTRLATAPAAALAIEIQINGNTYKCTGRETAINDSAKKDFPVRFIEYGRYFQHVQITGLIMKDSNGKRLDADCWLEIASWPDNLNISLHISNRSGAPDKMLLALPGRQAGGTIHGQDVSLVVLPLIQGANSAALEDITISAPKQKAPVLTAPAANGGLLVTLRGAGWHSSPANGTGDAELDRIDKWPLTLKNDTAVEKVFRLRFDTRPRNIVGFTSMLLDERGHPTGIPVQISKNWHKSKTHPMRFEGEWTHGSVVIRVPARKTVRYQYALTYARWGGVPAASHAQLCLVGWGHNMMWDQAAVGSFGETICYEPGRTQVRSFITDVRPLMTKEANKKKWGWTGNVGGGDFLVYFDSQARYMPMVGNRNRYYSYGPNLTKVVYDESTLDNSIEASYTVRLARVDDYVRVFHHIRYKVLKTIDFTRLAFYQMPSDYYNYMKYSKVAIGNTDGLGEEWDVRNGAWEYDRKSIPLKGTHPWISLHGVADEAKVEQAARGLILRKWDAVLGGKPCEPHISTFMVEQYKNKFLFHAELSPPPGLKQLKAGDYVDAEIELVVLPSKQGIYYGPDMDFTKALERDANTWKMVHREAAGNNLAVSATAGTLLDSYPIVINVNASQQADFSVAGGVGYVPITFTGLRHYTGYRLKRINGGKTMTVNQSIDGNAFWQTDYDERTGTYSITYNVKIDNSGDQPTRFAFGP